MIMILIMLALKSAIRDFYTISSLRRELSPTRTLKRPWRNRVQITCNTRGAHCVQHVVCHEVRWDRSGIKFGKA